MSWNTLKDAELTILVGMPLHADKDLLLWLIPNLYSKLHAATERKPISVDAYGVYCVNCFTRLGACIGGAFRHNCPSCISRFDTERARLLMNLCGTEDESRCCAILDRMNAHG